MIATFKIRRSLWLLTIAMAFFSLSEAAHAARVKEMASISGQRGNQLVGYGLVVGLDATGDSSWTSANSGVSQSVASLLESLDVTLPPGSRLNSRNVAAVMLTAELPALAKPGQVGCDGVIVG